MEALPVPSRYFQVHPGTSRAILIKKLKVYHFLFFAKFGHVGTDKKSDFIRFLKLCLETKNNMSQHCKEESYKCQAYELSLEPKLKPI